MRRIAIPEPCPEDWHAMTPVAPHQRHCAHCDRCVTDLTQLPDDDVLRLLDAHQGQRFCGRLTTDQLERLNTPSVRRARHRWPQAVLALVGIGAVTQAHAQATTQSAPVQTPPADAPASSEVSANTTGAGPAWIITGRVVETGTNLPLQGVHVLVAGTDQGTATDDKGRFQLDLSALHEPWAKVRVLYLGYAERQFYVARHSCADLYIDLQATTQVIAEARAAQQLSVINGAIVGTPVPIKRPWYLRIAPYIAHQLERAQKRAGVK